MDQKSSLRLLLANERTRHGGRMTGEVTEASGETAKGTQWQHSRNAKCWELEPGAGFDGSSGWSLRVGPLMLESYRDSSCATSSIGELSDSGKRSDICTEDGTEEDLSKAATLLARLAHSEDMPLCQLRDELIEFFMLFQGRGLYPGPGEALTDMLTYALEEAEEEEKKMLFTLYVSAPGDDSLVEVSCVNMNGSKVASLREHHGFTVGNLRGVVASQTPRRFQLLLPNGRALTQEDDGLSLEKIAVASSTVNGQVGVDGNPSLLHYESETKLIALSSASNEASPSATTEEQTPAAQHFEDCRD